MRTGTMVLLSVGAFFLAQKLFASGTLQSLVSAVTPKPAAPAGVTIQTGGSTINIPIPSVSTLESDVQSLFSGTSLSQGRRLTASRAIGRRWRAA